MRAALSCSIHLSLGPNLPVQQHIREEPDVLHHRHRIRVQAELPVVPEQEERSAAASVQKSLQGQRGAKGEKAALLVKGHH